MPHEDASVTEVPPGGAPATRVDARGPVPGAGPAGRPSLGWTELLVAVVVYLGLSIGVGVLLLVALPGIVAVLAVTGLVTLAAAVIALALRVRSLPALGLRPTTATWLLLGVAGGVLGWLVNRVVIIGYITLTGDLSNPQEPLATASAAFGWEFVGMLAAGAVLVPFAEELLFRGVGYGALRRYGVGIAVVASSLVFGIAHGTNVVLPAAIVLGIITALLYERSRSIWPGVVAHGLNNAIVFVSALILL
ncbi:MAG TPA: type II CAAX endopeptidase family protein [Pseudonocardia sp.]|jgi:membrane protease YdiL (CAAX protease family)|nr:type II CAAX endopeptidase family protein [Pseudonocardia sp.]